MKRLNSRNYRHEDQVKPPQNIDVIMYTMNSNSRPSRKYIRTFLQNNVRANVLDV